MNGFNRECVTCRRLGSCADTSPEKILGHYVCTRFEEVERPESVQARCHIINKYGAHGLRALIAPNGTVEEA